MSHPRTEPEINARLDAIDSQIDSLLSEWENLIDYKIGDRTVNKSQALELLRSERDALLARLASLPAEDIVVYDDPNF